ncbi:MAG TPA: hypothetical protein VN646_26085 [Candidatus Acidoferrum sp.]|nr:hypothetical protein [Candidatus Acidoferrum sp.]
MPGRRARVEAEVRKLLGVAVFFALASCLVVFSDKLLVWGSQIKTATFATAIVAGLIIAKVLLLVDLLPFVDAYPHKPLLYNIAWKAPIYIAAVLVFRYTECLIHHLFGGAGLAAASYQAVQPFAEPAFWASGIWLAVLFLVFLATRELSRAMGKDKMRLLFLGR